MVYIRESEVPFFQKRHFHWLLLNGLVDSPAYLPRDIGSAWDQRINVMVPASLLARVGCCWWVITPQFCFSSRFFKLPICSYSESPMHERATGSAGCYVCITRR